MIIKGGGDLATGVAARLWRSGFPIVMTEIERPLTVRRTVALSEAVHEGTMTVEDMRACRVQDPAEIRSVLDEGVIPVLVDPEAAVVHKISPFAVVDAIIAKKNLGTDIHDAPFVVGCWKPY